LSDQIHDRKQEKELVGCTMAGGGQPATTALIGVEAGKLIQVSISPLSGGKRYSQTFLFR
jgi:hypothetical protein